MESVSAGSIPALVAEGKDTFAEEDGHTGILLLKSKGTVEGFVDVGGFETGSWETVADFIFLGSKITVDGDCSHDIKWHVLLGRKAMINIDSILSRRDITLPIKVHI